MNWKEPVDKACTAFPSASKPISEEELKSLLINFQSYLEQFEIRFSNLISQAPCLDETGIDFDLVLRSYQNILVLVESSIKLKRFVEKRVGPGCPADLVFKSNNQHKDRR